MWGAEMKRKIPIGISDFQTIIEDNYYYVDKSLFIQEVLDLGARALLLPRPRRFGKTLNLSMLRYFFEKTDQDHSHLFKNLTIWQQGDMYTSKQGRYPVIYLTFKDVKSDRWDFCYDMFGNLIAKEYGRHRYLLTSDLLGEDEKTKFTAILNCLASEFNYASSIKELSEYLHRYHNEKVIILIDEYDTPVHCGYLDGFYDDVIGFIRILLGSALKDNTSMEKGVLTGILRVSKESVFSGLNNLEVFSLLSPEFSDHFGLMDNEVEELLNYYEIGFNIVEVKDWYNGYVFGGQTMYNPWSILNYSSKWSQGFRPYWVNTSSNDLVKSIITRSGTEVKEDLEQLILGNSITKIVDDNIVFGEIESNADTVWSFLLFCGYLKAVSMEYRNKRLYVELRIPNMEVEYLYEEIIISWFSQSIYDRQLHRMLRGLTSGDLELFESIFRDFIEKTFSYFDASGKEPEKVYHAFILGLLVSLQETYEVKSNQESGYGRYDVMLIPRDPRNKGIVFEFKKVNKQKNETLTEAVDRALEQIEQKKYAQTLTERGVSDILLLGIAFQGKEVLLKSREYVG